MPNRGGRRDNAGRPRGQGKYGEPTVTMRIPESQGATIKNFLDAYQRKSEVMEWTPTTLNGIEVPK